MDQTNLLIDDVALWDGTNSDVHRGMSVEVRDGRIFWIGSASDWRGNRTNIRVVDGRARTLIPGLMDCHVHYSSPGGPDWITRFTDPLPEISIRAVELAETSLRSGVTTARDVGAPQGVSIRLARAQKAGELRAPNIHAAGTWIAHQGTYVSFARHFGDANELRSAIQAEIESGADLIKVALAPWNEGARPKDGAEVAFDEKLLAVAVKEAHKANFKIACHANDAVSCHIAAHAGVDSLEHGMYLQLSDLESMAKNGTFLVPTMSVWDAMLYYSRAVDWPEARKKRAEDLREGSRKAVSSAVTAGVKVALGTDAGGGAARHGRLAREAELMVECGMDPKDALLAGTARAAELIGEPERGTLSKGKIADMVLLDANPLENVSGLRLVAAVFQSGRRVA
ncbi:MAG TPA: amidohydrolase family protein [Candidatus Dormibacteraeota bacterium]|nr:amidohydrolase family protein [Candidatus Dormibacteraeota bacterium]